MKLSKMEETMKKGEPELRIGKMVIAPSMMEGVESEIEGSGIAYKEMSLEEMVGGLKYGIDSVSPEDMIEILRLIQNDEITDRGGIEIIRTILDEGGSPGEIVKKKGLKRVESDAVVIAVTEAISENENAVNDYKNGKNGALNFLVGQVMKKTRGTADPAEVQRILKEKLL
ncbi:MAG: hypothetical protein SVM80_08550 [Halobacteriota archaeon]|nr:hypothetical protein [Halobacteriota archaeon]